MTTALPPPTAQGPSDRGELRVGTRTTMATLTAALVGAKEANQSKTGIVMSVVFYCAVVAAIGGVWGAAAEANGGTIGPYTSSALVTYYFASEIVTIALPGRVITQRGDHISSQGLVAELLRPVGPHWIWIGREWGRGWGVAVWLTATGLVGSALVGNLVHQGAAQVALFLGSLALALSIHVLLLVAWSSLSYWGDSASVSWFIYQKLLLIGGGVLLPLNMLPSSLEIVLSFSPWAAISFIPAVVASGTDSVLPVPALLVLQGGWLVVLPMIVHQLHRRGQERILRGHR